MSDSMKILSWLWPPKREEGENFWHYERRRHTATDACTCFQCQEAGTLTALVIERDALRRQVEELLADILGSWDKEQEDE